MTTPLPPLMSGRRAVIAWMVLWTVVGLLSFFYQYLDLFARAEQEPFYVKLVEEMTGGYATGVLSLGIIRIARWLGGAQRRWYATLAVHVAAISVYSALHTAMLWLSRQAVFAGLGLGRYDYGIMSYRFLMELPNDVIDYAIIAVLIHLALSYRASERRALRAAQLETELQQARLAMLEGQLRPHFLFNALNTISSVMYRDLSAADRMIQQLGDLLRTSLRTGDTHEVPLDREIETLDRYLGIMRVRFGERLDVAVDVDPAVADARVPSLLLQPLVENALAHGDAGPDHPMRVRVSAALRDHRLRLSVTDNGPGTSSSNGTGIGLRNTAERLRHLYGDGGRLSFGERDADGFEVIIEIPLRTSPSP